MAALVIAFGAGTCEFGFALNRRTGVCSVTDASGSGVCVTDVLALFAIGVAALLSPSSPSPNDNKPLVAFFFFFFAG